MIKKQVEELLLQSLAHEMGGVEIYETALECAQNPQLRTRWQEFLAETKTHVTTLQELCRRLDLGDDLDRPGCKVVQHIGDALLEAMRMALAAGDPDAAEIVAAECVVLAETKDHMDWELIGKCAENFDEDDDFADELDAAHERIESQEDEHLYYSKGWSRELWLRALGLPAILPPPEEQKEVKTAIGAARAEQSADKDR